MQFLVPRFPGVAATRPHYESFYVTATHPTDGTALWIRHTVRQPPGADPVGSVWLTWFGPDGIRAAKADGQPSSSTSHPIAIDGLGHLTRDGILGAIDVPGLAASWDLRFSGPETGLAHLPGDRWYTAAVPRTKPTSPRPDMTVDGTVVLDGAEVRVDGWRGMLGHNWGTEHAHRWIWLRGAGFAEDPTAWLDLVLARVRVGPLTLPWTAAGVLCLDRGRRRVGGPGRRTAVTTRADGCEIAVSGLRIVVDAPPFRSVGWEYADPSGSTHLVRNCSDAGLVLAVDGRTLATTYGAAYELGGPDLDPAIAAQPFGDTGHPAA